MLHSEETPFARDTLQGMHSVINEAQAGPSYQVFDCARDEDLAWAGLSHHACPDMHSNPADLVAHRFTLTRVQPRSDGDPEACDSVPDGTRAADSSRRSVKGSKEGVTSRVDFPTPKAMQFPPDKAVMALKEVAPLTISQFDGSLSCTDNIREQYRDKHPVGFRALSGTREELLDLIENGVHITPVHGK